jgi:hypothetical protein
VTTHTTLESVGWRTGVVPFRHLSGDLELLFARPGGHRIDELGEGLDDAHE